jgi:hypothetical protein
MNRTEAVHKIADLVIERGLMSARQEQQFLSDVSAIIAKTDLSLEEKLLTATVALPALPLTTALTAVFANPNEKNDDGTYVLTGDQLRQWWDETEKRLNDEDRATAFGPALHQQPNWNGEVYVVITWSDHGTIQDLEILDQPPTFELSPMQLVRVGNVNGGDSVWWGPGAHG